MNRRPLLDRLHDLFHQCDPVMVCTGQYFCEGKPAAGVYQEFCPKCGSLGAIALGPIKTRRQIHLEVACQAEQQHSRQRKLGRDRFLQFMVMAVGGIICECFTPGEYIAQSAIGIYTVTNLFFARHFSRLHFRFAAESLQLRQQALETADRLKDEPL